jgi:hypothetical protein
MGEQKQIQSRTTMVFFALFLGTAGIHRLLMGYKNWWLMLFTLGGFGIWMLADVVRIVSGRMKMADGRELI